MEESGIGKNGRIKDREESGIGKSQGRALRCNISPCKLVTTIS